MTRLRRVISLLAYRVRGARADNRPTMNGAQSLIQTLVNGGVDTCFTNPGTSEMAFVAAVDRVPGMRTILALFEGVATGAADGYARMAGKPACTLLHLGPGLGNGIANLHNARRANSPLINIVGEHATWHLQYEAPLKADIRALASAVSGWIRTCASPESVAQDAVEAIGAACAPPGQVATIIFPGDCMWNDGPEPLGAPALRGPVPVDSKAVDTIARTLRAAQARGETSALYVGGPAWSPHGQALATRIGAAVGARVFGHRFSPKGSRGAGIAQITRLAYPVPQAVAQLAGIKNLVMAGTTQPVGFFGYPNLPSELQPPDCALHTLATPEQDVLGALEALADALDAPGEPPTVNRLARPGMPDGELSVEKIWLALASLLPEGAIISDEAVTSSRASDDWMGTTVPHEWLAVTGGSIGQGMPVATGAAVACPDRKVINMEADGSAMYTLQALWTQAREQLDVLTVIFNNRTYAILQGEMKAIGLAIGPKAHDMLRIDSPTLDFVSLAQGMGVPASRATTQSEFNAALAIGLREKGPRLIEAMI